MAAPPMVLRRAQRPVAYAHAAPGPAAAVGQPPNAPAAKSSLAGGRQGAPQGPVPHARPQQPAQRRQLPRAALARRLRLVRAEAARCSTMPGRLLCMWATTLHSLSDAGPLSGHCLAGRSTIPSCLLRRRSAARRRPRCAPAAAAYGARSSPVDQQGLPAGLACIPPSRQPSSHPTPPHTRAPTHPPQVDFADVGCGFGGLTVRLAEAYPDKLVLGMELRDKVTGGCWAARR